jgi:hypothetical protein
MNRPQVSVHFGIRMFSKDGLGKFDNKEEDIKSVCCFSFNTITYVNFRVMSSVRGTCQSRDLPARY